MWQHLFIGFIGFSAGFIVAGGVVGLLIGLSVIPRYAGITRTASHVMLYEDITFLGTVFGNCFLLFHWNLPLGESFLLLYGLFSGIFLGGWILALAEMADIFPIFSRRLQLTFGLPLLIICVALGKTFGSFLYYYKHWMP